MQERDFEGRVEEAEPSTDPVVDGMITISESRGFQVDSDDAEDLVEEHSEELNRRTSSTFD